MAVHRKLFELLHDTHLSPHEYVCHSCDNPPCINPEHLWLGDSRANQLDSVAKGRHKSQGGVRTAEKARRR